MWTRESGHWVCPSPHPSRRHCSRESKFVLRESVTSIETGFHSQVAGLPSVDRSTGLGVHIRKETRICLATHSDKFVTVHTDVFLLIDMNVTVVYANLVNRDKLCINVSRDLKKTRSHPGLVRLRPSWLGAINCVKKCGSHSRGFALKGRRRVCFWWASGVSARQCRWTGSAWMHKSPICVA